MAERTGTSDLRSGDTPVPATRASNDKSFVTPYYICGPTASGKSALALEMARQLDGEIVNAAPFRWGQSPQCNILPSRKAYLFYCGD